MGHARLGVGLTTATARTILGSGQTSGRAEQVAQRLGEAIRLGLILDGERLPSEVQLSEQLGIATVTLREALATLREQGLIVNGHVPVEVEKGESPLKRSGKAITIDGAFSESLGDHGFTLVLEPHQTFLALHYHFESVEAAILRGADIIPSITVVRDWGRPKRLAESQRGRRLQSTIAQLERLIEAYRNHELRELPAR